MLFGLREAWIFPRPAVLPPAKILRIHNYGPHASGCIVTGGIDERSEILHPRVPDTKEHALPIGRPTFDGHGDKLHPEGVDERVLFGGGIECEAV